MLRRVREPRPQNKNKARNNINCRPADYRDKRLFVPNREHPERGNGRPADDIAESHENPAPDHPLCRALAQLAQIHGVFHHFADGFFLNKIISDFSSDRVHI